MDTSKQSQRGSLVARYALPPETIEQRSFAAIDGLVPSLTRPAETPGVEDERQIIRRIIHTTGDPSLGDKVRLHPAAVGAGVAAVRGGCDIITDVHMVAVGINRRLAERFGCAVRCAMENRKVQERARAYSTTRAVAAMRCMAGDANGQSGSPLDGSIVAIGNAPTALLALLDLIDEGKAHPALIVGVPVGFIAAAESKAELMQRQIPYITIPGTRGGSTIAAATLNAILLLASRAD